MIYTCDANHLSVDVIYLRLTITPQYTQPLRDIRPLAPAMPTASNKWSDEQNCQVVKNLKVAKYLGL